ncbi:protein translocase subunit SecF [Candidatus Amesbacteria bacterium]|nr:protein translocase subunit SecF [Candidatus Amesbacteria bacterium]
MKLLKYKYIYFLISLLIVIPGIISLVKYRLRLSIDFTGGSLLEIQSKVSKAKLEEIAKTEKLEVNSIQTSSDNVYLLRLKELSNDQKIKYLKLVGDATEKRFENVGPIIGKELTQKAILSIVVASFAIVLYMAWSFRQIPKSYASWKFGASAVLALLHDALVVLGLFSIFGALWHVEVDSLFVTAVLTVIGFSVHDTIVVFDRIRENLPKMPQSTFEEVVDFSISETLVRSINTSLTAVLTLLCLLLFGGSNIRWFVVALLVGIVSGTYSSIFNAAPLLVLWESKRK